MAELIKSIDILEFIHRYIFELLLVAAFAAGTAAWAGLRRWKDAQLESRPTVTGRIESVEIGEPTGLALNQNDRFEARLHYRYVVTNEEYTGIYKRRFENETSAWEFADSLDGRHVPVRYRTDKSSSSTLSYPELETIIQTSHPSKYKLEEGSYSTEPLFGGWRILLIPLISLAALGLVASLYIAIQSFMGRKFGMQIFTLHVGVFVVFAPAVLLMIFVQRQGGSGKDIWKDLLSQFPGWTKYLFYGLFAAAVIATTITGRAGVQNDSSGVLGFAGVWAIFYGSSLLTYIAAYRMRVAVLHGCPRGHGVEHGSRRCGECGRPLRRLLTTDHS